MRRPRVGDRKKFALQAAPQIPQVHRREGDKDHTEHRTDLNKVLDGQARDGERDHAQRDDVDENGDLKAVKPEHALQRVEHEQQGECSIHNPERHERLQHFANDVGRNKNEENEYGQSPEKQQERAREMQFGPVCHCNADRNRESEHKRKGQQ